MNTEKEMDLLQTQIAIKFIKDTFERRLAEELHLTRVSAPLMVFSDSGLNDNLNGYERPVSFEVPAIGKEAEIVHSLAKWKRLALKEYGLRRFKGIYTDMNAIRRDEQLDNIHSIYVDQWDWEKVINEEDRTLSFLEGTVSMIMNAVIDTQKALIDQYPFLQPAISHNVLFITSQQLLDRYPHLNPRQREDEICRQYGTVFVEQIGAPLSDGQPHDGRAPDYDDWQLNGDLLTWYQPLERSVEISSMGIRVSPESLISQLTAAGCPDRLQLPFHRALAAGQLPLTMGGGIGQSRLCLLMLNKVHIGEVQSSLWPQQMIDQCREEGIELL
ncbi:MAG: aspartate--ammonia ligase [Erysipelotrichaceae bacterium]|nr:aspartate--ammonia ligase [Erysipelotrichaceae bacterium]MBR5049390.1 aspartate--ammonia ligase [Erysipelotrichaceae bacterium]